MIPVWVYFYLGFAAFVAASALIPLCKKLSRRFDVVDYPGPKVNGKLAIPLLGGVAIFISFVIVVFGHFLGAILFPHDWLPQFAADYLPGAVDESRHLLVMAGGGLVFFLVGLLDDKKAISVKARFLFEFLAAGTLIASGMRFGLGFLPNPLALIITAVWIVGISNAFNLLDGLDGLAGGVTIICSCILAVVMIRSGQPLIAMVVIVLAGSAAGFLRHNIFPARIYMGSSGSLFLGYVLAISVVRASFGTNAHSPVFPIFMPVLLMAVPLYDTASVMLIRWRAGRPVFKGDRSHTHHRLLGAGFSAKGAVLFIWLLTFMTGISSIFLMKADLLSSILVFTQVAVAFALIVLAKHVRLQRFNGINHHSISNSDGIGMNESRDRKGAQQD